MAHLGENKVKLDDGTMFQCGEYLKFDPQAEKFASAKANEFLTREYRAPFVVPTAGQYNACGARAVPRLPINWPII